MAAYRRLLTALCVALLSTAACDDTVPPPAYPPAALPAPPEAGEVVDEPAAQDVPIGVENDAYADTDPSALTEWRPVLDPHGTWVEDATYGMVWVPRPEEVGADFTPYVSAGHWVYDDDDYVWVSDYEWGWVPFHYGRWVWIGGYGWSWISGRTYASAWVVWRMGDDQWAYVGWAPMPPVWIWRHGIAVGIGVVPWVPYVFCPREEIFAPTIRGHIIVGERATVIGAHTRPYVHAAPVVVGHPFAQPRMRGPAPHTIGVEPSRVPHVVPDTRGVWHARELARPSTAQPRGARPATPHVVQSRPMVMPSIPPRTTPRAPVRVAPAPAPRAPATRAPARR